MKRLLTLLAALPMAALLMTACGNDNGRKAPVTIVDRSVLYCESTYPYEGGVLIANFGSSSGVCSRSCSTSSTKPRPGTVSTSMPRP